MTETAIILQVCGPVVKACQLSINIRRAKENSQADARAIVWECSESTPWGNRLSCETNTQTRLPASAELRDSGRGWLWKLLFNQEAGTARYMRRNPLTAAIAVKKLALDGHCHDPLSALEAVRLGISDRQTDLRVHGTAGVGRFVLTAGLEGQEALELPAGRFQTLRLACQVSLITGEDWDQEKGPYPFTLWLSHDQLRLPLRAAAPTSLGDLTMQAIEISTSRASLLAR
jgi:hypothetical protein